MNPLIQGILETLISTLRSLERGELPSPVRCRMQIARLEALEKGETDMTEDDNLITPQKTQWEQEFTERIIAYERCCLATAYSHAQSPSAQALQYGSARRDLIEWTKTHPFPKL